MIYRLTHKILLESFELYCIFTPSIDPINKACSIGKFQTLMSTDTSKYFGTNKGITAMTLVANHSALNARIIGSNEHESHYIYDLLQSNTSDLKPDVLSTDTHVLYI